MLLLSPLRLEDGFKSLDDCLLCRPPRALLDSVLLDRARFREYFVEALAVLVWCSLGKSLPADQDMAAAGRFRIGPTKTGDC